MGRRLNELCSGDDRGVQSIEHGNAIGLVERVQGEFVDQCPPSETQVDLSIEGLDLALLVFDARDPTEYTRILLSDFVSF